jgi:hypothetical protein
MKRFAQLCGVGMGLNLLMFSGPAEAQGLQATLDPGSKRAALTESMSFETSTALDPTKPVPVLAARLALDGTMRFYPAAGGQADVVQIDVTNQGFSPAAESEVSVGLWSYPFSGTLYQYWGGTATTPNTVNGTERGFIHIEVWPGVLQECRSYEVSVALPVQDTILTGTIATQCPLRWTTPIDAQRLGSTPDPLIAGKTLEDIVSSRVQGSAKGLCSNCHNKESGEPPYYKPNIPRGATTVIGPFDEIGHHIGSPDGYASWAFGGTSANGGTYYSWSEWFISRSDKPQGLKVAFSKWIADGSQR